MTIRRIGLLPLGRATFDVPFAEAMLSGQLSAADDAFGDVVGPRELLFDAAAAEAAMTALAQAKPDAILVLQVTFTDAGSLLALARRFPDTPLAVWAVPEPRLGGRLRLNAFCGLNLAGHALGLADRSFGALYAAPDTVSPSDLRALFEPQTMTRAPAMRDAAAATAVPAALAGKRIARIGERPDGFTTCDYDAHALWARTGLAVEEIGLPALFERARAVPPPAVAAQRAALGEAIDGMGKVDADELDRSIRLERALDAMTGADGYAACAIRCWPETFTEYGGAVCGGVSLSAGRRVPCACEADVWGAATQLLLQAVADAPVFLTDMVDVDASDDTIVFWHCGQAPLAMLGDGARAQATIHTNRRMPLLMQFALRPGRVTYCRLSTARGREAMVVGTAEMLDRPMAFTGTSGVAHLPMAAPAFTRAMLDFGLEHHVALAYGDHRAALRAAAEGMGLPVVEFGA